MPILAHKLLAGAVTGARSTARSGPSTGRASPITTEGGVKDGKVVLEKLPWIAGSRGVVGHGLVPGTRERSTVCNIFGYFVAREKVDGDPRVVPLHRIDASAGFVKGSTVAVIRVTVLHATPRVSSLGRSAVRASVEGTDRVEDVRRYGAAGASVDRDLIYLAVVNAFDNVDLTFVRPVGAVGPEGGPSAAPDGHVDGIKDEETTVEDVAVVETDRLTIGRDIWGGLNAQNGIASAVNLDELVVQCTILVLVVDGAMGGVGEGPEVPAIEEGAAFLEDRESAKVRLGLDSAWARLGPGLDSARLGCPDRHGRQLTFVTLSFQGDLPVVSVG